MAFVFQHAKSPFWYMGYAGADQRQIKRSTKLRVKLTPKKIAQAFAQKMEEAEYLAKIGTIAETRARSLVGEVVEKTTGARLAFPSVEDWLQTWLDGKESTKARSTFLCYRKAVLDFLAHLTPSRSARSLELVTVRDFQSFRDRQVKEGKTSQTANNVLKTLRMPFTLARKQGLIPMNPADVVERLATSHVARGTFSHSQLKALVAAAEGDWRGAVLAGIYTGQRLRDIANLRWEAVDLPTRTVAFVQLKNKRRVVLPLHDDLEAWLIACPAPQSGKAFVFPRLAGKGTGGAHGLSGRFKAIMKTAGIEAELSRTKSTVKGTKGRDLSSLSFHSLRHTFNSIMANAGIAQEVRQELTGHASAEMNRLYTHHELASFRVAVETLPSFGGEQSRSAV